MRPRGPPGPGTGLSPAGWFQCSRPGQARGSDSRGRCPVSHPDEARRVEIKDGEQTVAAADVSKRPDGATRASLHPTSGHVAPGHRAELVDAIVDLPEVRDGDRLEASVPL